MNSSAPNPRAWAAPASLKRVSAAIMGRSRQGACDLKQGHEPGQAGRLLGQDEEVGQIGGRGRGQIRLLSFIFMS